MQKFMSECDESDLGQSAIVFSPHQDDETLGCGGTIIRKKKVGADVKIVFMTDGCRSHSHLISENELKSIRSQEAIAATQMLGVKQDDVYFLEFKDGELDKNQDAAIRKVTDILRGEQPDEIFIPCYEEAPADHFYTNKIIASALQIYGKKVVVYEYPIWLWCHWPWTNLIGSRRQILNFLKNSCVSNLTLLKDFRCSVYIGDVLDLKRTALDQHKSQMVRLIPDPRWLTLDSLSNGEFLQCFFQEQEIFRRYISLEKN
jgi:LmbE family N-acetylglucosaminyl deacetylase